MVEIHPRDSTAKVVAEIEIGMGKGPPVEGRGKDLLKVDGRGQVLLRHQKRPVG